jgi:hypothetical protein
MHDYFLSGFSGFSFLGATIGDLEEGFLRNMEPFDFNSPDEDNFLTPSTGVPT